MNVTIFDDDIMEEFEFINLRLSTRTPDIVFTDQSLTTIEITDDDGIKTISCMQVVSVCANIIILTC